MHALHLYFNALIISTALTIHDCKVTSLTAFVRTFGIFTDLTTIRKMILENVNKQQPWPLLTGLNEKTLSCETESFVQHRCHCDFTNITLFSTKKEHLKSIFLLLFFIFINLDVTAWLTTKQSAFGLSLHKP